MIMWPAKGIRNLQLPLRRTLVRRIILLSNSKKIHNNKNSHFMGRELRRVPADWEHPKRYNGDYQPMFKKFYGDALAEWLKEHQQWEDGTHPDLIEKPERKQEYPFYAMWGGNPPDVEYYQTRRYSEEELTHIQLYETTSEGTPKSPVFPKEQFEQLCEWAADNCTTFAHFKATKEQWMKMLKDDFVYHQQGNAIFM